MTSKNITKKAESFLDKTIKPVVKVLIATSAVVLLLGLAAKGAQTYLANMTDTQQTIVSVVAVVLLAVVASWGTKK